MSKRKVDYTEAPVTKRNKFILKETAVIRASMPDCAGHPLQDFGCAFSRLNGRKPRNSAHSASI
jgi:hypothetical protein